MSTPDLQCVGTTGHFYHRPLPGTEVRFSQQPVGGNKLATLNKSICTKVVCREISLTTQKNEPVRYRFFMRVSMNRSMVSSRTGQRSMAIQDYKVPSDEQ